MRDLVDEVGIGRFMAALARRVSTSSRVFLTGGATAVLFGWRRTTIDVDLKLIPESDEILRAIPALKNELALNVELASPDQFIPPLPGWETRSLFIRQEGPLSFYHYDLYAQAMAKIERGHGKDLADARAMVDAGLVETDRLLVLFEEIEPDLYRYPAIDPGSFRRAVEQFVRREAEGNDALIRPNETEEIGDRE